MTLETADGRELSRALGAWVWLGCVLSLMACKPLSRAVRLGAFCACKWPCVRLHVSLQVADLLESTLACLTLKRLFPRVYTTMVA